MTHQERIALEIVRVLPARVRKLISVDCLLRAAEAAIEAERRQPPSPSPPVAVYVQPDWWQQGNPSSRLRSIIKNVGTTDIDQITALGESHIRRLPRVGRNTIVELRELLARYGRCLAP